MLADELSLEVDALLPSVDTAVLLGMLKLEEGDAIITPDGQAFAQGTFKSEKRFFAGRPWHIFRYFDKWNSR